MASLDIKLQIDYKPLVNALAHAPEILRKELRTELAERMEKVANIAKKRHRFIPRSGDLERSVSHSVDKSGLEGTVELEKGEAKYGEYVHNGTGLYGPRKRAIKPVKAKALKFIGKDGRWVSKKEVNGIRPDPFVYNAMKSEIKNIEKGASEAITRALKKAGVGQ